MEVSKRQVVEYFFRRNDIERAQQADESLPDPVEPDRDADQLRALGIDPGLLATQIDNLEA